MRKEKRRRYTDTAELKLIHTFFCMYFNILTFKDDMHKKPELLSAQVLHNNCCCWNESKPALSSTMHQASPVLRAGIAKKSFQWQTSSSRDAQIRSAKCPMLQNHLTDVYRPLQASVMSLFFFLKSNKCLWILVWYLCPVERVPDFKTRSHIGD